jgi:hypothetical protein
VIAYFDTSAVVPLVVEEVASGAAGRLWDEADRVASVRLLYAEGRAALAQAERMGRISAGDLRSAVTEFEGLFAQVDIIEIAEDLTRRAGELAESEALRGYDAVHLAGLQALGPGDVVLVTGDEDLRGAAERLGFAVVDLT